MVDDWELLDELRVAIGRKPRSPGRHPECLCHCLGRDHRNGERHRARNAIHAGHGQRLSRCSSFFAAWYWQIDGRISAAASPAAWRCSPRMSRCSCQVSVGDTLPGSGRRLCHTCWRPALRSRKYFSTNSPSRAARGAPQTRQAISPSLVVSGPASPLSLVRPRL